MTFALAGQEDAAAGAACAGRGTGFDCSCTAGAVCDDFGKRGGTTRAGRGLLGTDEARGAGDDSGFDLAGGGATGSCATCGEEDASGS